MMTKGLSRYQQLEERLAMVETDLRRLTDRLNQIRQDIDQDKQTGRTFLDGPDGAHRISEPATDAPWRLWHDHLKLSGPGEHEHHWWIEPDNQRLHILHGHESGHISHSHSHRWSDIIRLLDVS